MRAQASASQLVKPPIVVVNEGGGVTAWVRLNGGGKRIVRGYTAE